MSATRLALLWTYHQCREHVVQWLRAAGGRVVTVSAAPKAMHNHDGDYPCRHDSYLCYLTGFTRPRTMLAIVTPVGSTPAHDMLFCRPKHGEREVWSGSRLDPETARDAFGPDEAYPVERIDATPPKLLTNTVVAVYPLTKSSAFDRCMCHWLDAVRMQDRTGMSLPCQALDVCAILGEVRLFKDASKLDIMRRARRIPAGTHMCAMRASHAGLREYHLGAEPLYEFHRHSA